MTGGYELTRQDVQQLALSMQGIADLKDEVSEIKRLLLEDKRNCGDCKKEIFVELNTIKTQHAEDRGASVTRSQFAVIGAALLSAAGVFVSIWYTLRNGG